MCLPYFLRKTRPRASYGLLEAFTPSLTADRASPTFPIQPAQSRAHMGAWKPESRSIYHTRAGNPNPGWGRPGSSIRRSIRERQSQSSLAYPVPAHPHPAAPSYRPKHPHPRAHTRAPTPEHPHPTKKKIKKKLDTFVFRAYSAAITR